MFKRLRSIDLLPVLLSTSGLITILSVPFKHLAYGSYDWLPFNPYHLAHISALILGLSLVYAASQLHRRRRSAYLITVALLVSLIILECARRGGPHFIVPYLVCLTLAIRQRKWYVVRSDISSMRHSLALATTLLVCVLLFGMVVFARIDQNEFGQRLTTSQTARVTAQAMLGKPLPQSLHPTRRDHGLVLSLQAAAIVALTIIAGGLFQPIKLRRGSSAHSRQQAEMIIQYYGASSEDYLKLWPSDKHYFFYKDSFLAYGVRNGIAVVLDGASGKALQLNKLRQAFVAECRINAWQIAILHADQKERDAWQELGFGSLYLGSEARVDIAAFCANKIRDKHFRYINNKATKDGLEVRELVRPFTTHDIRQLRQVSDAWLASGRREYSFIMGYFDESYLATCRVFAVYRNQDIIAYTNLLPTFGRPDHSIDHMRFRPDVSPATMHFLLMHTIASLHSDGQRSLNLGLSPLSKIDDNTANLAKSLLGTIRKLGGRYYSFAGLEQFKNKFGPNWEPTYLLYGKLTDLARIGTAVSGLSTYKMATHALRWPIAVAALAGACYAAFPLAIVLNPSYALRGLVSQLGQSGEPYAAVFNTLDITSSVLLVLLCLYLLRASKHTIRLLRYCLYLLAASAIGNLLAAYFQLPPGFEVDSLAIFNNLNVLMHGVSSLINSSAYVAAVVLWGVWAKQQHNRWHKRHVLVIGIIALSTIGFMIGQLWPGAGALIQRGFILCYAIWLVVFVRDIIAYTIKR